MSDDRKVISLAGRVRAKAAHAAESARPTSAPATEPGHVDSASDARPAPGTLVWLYCPACKSLEYTEQRVPGGRMHNACGTRVQEAEVQMDLRAEFTLAEFNLRHLDQLGQVLETQIQRYREYQQRLKLAAGGKLQGYPLTDETLQRLPVAGVDPLGMMISPFLHESAQRFAPATDAQAEPAPPTPAPGQSEGQD